MTHWFIKHPETDVTLLDLPAEDEEAARTDALRHDHVRAVADQFGTLTIRPVGQNGAES